MITPRPKTSVVWKIPRHRLVEIIDQSRSMSDALRMIGLDPKGGNSATLKRRLSADGIDFNDLLDSGTRNHRGFGASQPLEEVLVAESSYSRTALKKRLLKCELLKNECRECGLGPVWREKRLTLTLDHINGISNDNRLENLRLLCPNCNSQTPTFAARNKGAKRGHTSKALCACGNTKSKKSSKCKRCFSASCEVVQWPTDRELIELIRSTSVNHVAKQIGVSFNALKKRVKTHGLLV